MITQSEQITNLAAALLKAQRDIGAAIKDAANPYFKSSYADLKAVIEAVKGPLNKNGITFLQAVDSMEDIHPVIDTILLHESGQYLSSRTPVFCAKSNDPQAFGSGVTYSKRYALQALLGLPTTDDDGEAAMARNGKPQAKKAPSPIKIVKAAFDEFIEARKIDIPEHFICDYGLFKTELRTEFKKQTPVKNQKGFAWTEESVKPFVLAVDISKMLVEVKEA